MLTLLTVSLHFSVSPRLTHSFVASHPLIHLLVKLMAIPQRVGADVSKHGGYAYPEIMQSTNSNSGTREVKERTSSSVR